MLKPVYLTENDVVRILDQRKLPFEEVWLDCRTYEEIADAIKTLAVRGAPAIGIAAAYGFYIALKDFQDLDYQEFVERALKVKEILASTRPTAVNLFWALERMFNVVRESSILPVHKIIKRLRAEALRIQEEDLKACLDMAEYGVSLLKDKVNVLTHCNAGALATGGYGTALGVIRRGYETGKVKFVFIDETRPLLQGARLTSWELLKEGIPCRVISDNMAGYFMSKGMVDVVIVGADRITARGDVANKIGTYSLAVLAKHHGIPLMVVAPTSTFDLKLSSGTEIPIEERSEEEVLCCYGRRITPMDAKAFNPAFDVTPAELVTWIVTEKGVVKHPFEKSIKALFSE